MLNIGPLELVVIFVIALVVVGPRKLPELGRTIGKGLREFRKAQEEVRRSLELDDLQDVRREIADTQRGFRDALRFETPGSGGADGSGVATDDAGEDAMGEAPHAHGSPAAPDEPPAPPDTDDRPGAPEGA